MTDKARIHTLIAKVESGQVGREENDEYLALTGGCPWDIKNMKTGEINARPDPLTNAQDALDSLLEGVETCDAFSMTNIMSKVSGVSKWHWELSSGETGAAKTAAAAICTANLKRILAELE